MLDRFRSRIAKAIAPPQPPKALVTGTYPRFDSSARNLQLEYGRSGWRYQLPGWPQRDHLPELSGRNLWTVLQEMGDNDAYCGATLNAYSMFIRRSDWTVQPASKEKEDLEAAEFLESCMGDMGHSWKTVIAAASTAVPQYGFCPFEKIFKVRNGENEDDPRYGSEYDDGLIGWSNLALRSPDTVLHWNYDPQDVTRLRGLTQLAAPDWRQVFIPIEKLLILRATPGKDSPEGRSLLRSSYRAWRTKKIMEDFRNIIIERGGAGIPWAEVPQNIVNAPAQLAADPLNPAYIEANASYQSITEMLRSICLDTQQYIVTPQILDEKTGKELVKISFLQPAMGGDIVAHITAAIETEAKAILLASMTEFLALGMGSSGSLALSRDKTDNFTLSVSAILDAFESSINDQLVKQLFRLNPEFEDLKKLPKIVHDPVVPLSTSDVATIISLFEKAGWELKSQSTIRDTILQSIGLPDYEEQTALESDASAVPGKEPGGRAEAIQQIIEARSEAKKSARKEKRAVRKGAKYKTWRTRSGACDFCKTMEGERRKIGDPYSNGSQRAFGHPNCRCYSEFS